MTAFVNAYLEGDSIVLIDRREGVLHSTRVKADFVAYMRSADLDADRMRKLRQGEQGLSGFKIEGEWLRTKWRNWFGRKEACERLGQQWGLKTYEGDVGPITRYLVDNPKIEIARPRRCYLDLETDSRVPFARKEDMRVLSWALTDDEGNSKDGMLNVDTGEDEKRLLVEMWRAMGPYDQVNAWYGDGFDFPVMLARSERQGLNHKALGNRWLFLDQKEVFSRMNQAESGDEKMSLKLNDVAQAILGEGKHDFDASKTWEEWAAGGERRERMRRYNIQDTALLPKIEKKNGFLDLFLAVCQACGIFPNTRSLQPTAQMDGLLMRMGLERGLHFPTKEYGKGKTTAKYAGAYVQKPRFDGIARDVHVVDFSSLYPSIIISWNMSHETKTVRGEAPEPGVCHAPSTGARFNTDKRGLLPDALLKLMELRKHYSKLQASLVPGTPEWIEAGKKSQAYKVVGLSMYGCLGSPWSRFFDGEMAEAITQQGVWLIKRTAKLAEDSFRIFVGYIDTDSIYGTGISREGMAAFALECNETHFPAWLKECGTSACTVELAYEKAFDRIVFTAAKKYVGKYSHYKGKAATAASKPEIKGLEFKRGDALLRARQLQELVIKKLMAGCEDAGEFEKMIVDARTAIIEGELDIAAVKISKGLAKEIGEYQVKKKLDGTKQAGPMHVRVAKEMLAQGADVTAGTKIEYVVLDGYASPKVVIMAADYQGEFDRTYLWNNLVYPPTARLLAAAFPASEWKVHEVPRGKSKADSAQVALFGPPKKKPTLSKGAVLAMPPRPLSAQPTVTIRAGSPTRGALGLFASLVSSHPGGTPLLLEITTPAGVAVMAWAKKAEVTGEFVAQLGKIFPEGGIKGS